MNDFAPPNPEFPPPQGEVQPHFQPLVIQRKPMNKKLLIAGVIVVFLFFVFMVKGFMGIVAASAAEDARYDSLAVFAQPYLELAEGPNFALDPHVIGKLVVVDAESGHVNRYVQKNLPEALFASTPAEIGSIALLSWARLEVGSYLDPDTNQETGTAYQEFCTIRVVDATTHDVIAQDFIEGSPPSDNISYNGDASGGRPYSGVRKYLESLRRE